jgi:spoIIIJ-associated protein
MSHEGDVFEGKTLDAAVKNGLEALGLSRAEVMITILEEGSSGFLGIGARPYRVRVMRRPGGAPLAEPDAEARRHHGSGRGRRGRAQGDAALEAGRGAGRERRERRDERRGERRREGQGEARAESRGDRHAGRGDERREVRREEPRGERRDERREVRREEPRGERRDERREVRREEPRGERRDEPREERPDEQREERRDEPRGERREERRGEHPEPTEAPRLETAAVRPQEPGGPEEGRRRRRRGRRGGRRRHEGTAGVGGEATYAPEQGQAERLEVEPGAAEAPAQPPRHAEPRSDVPEAPSLPDDELAAQSRRLTEDLLKAMGFEAVVSATVDGNHVEVTAEVAKDEDLLTGRKGEVRQALQHLLNRMLNRGESSRYHLQLEINDFWKRREEELRELARSLAEEAVTSGGETVTEYLNAQERRIVHVTLREDSRVKTYALGTGMIKRVAIAPAGFEGGPGGESE